MQEKGVLVNWQWNTYPAFWPMNTIRLKNWLAKDIGYSRSQLFRKLKSLTGKTPVGLIRELRLHHAKGLLQKGAATVSEAAYESGYSKGF